MLQSSCLHSILMQLINLIYEDGHLVYKAGEDINKLSAYEDV